MWSAAPSHSGPADGLMFLLKLLLSFCLDGQIKDTAVPFCFVRSSSETITLHDFCQLAIKYKERCKCELLKAWSSHSNYLITSYSICNDIFYGGGTISHTREIQIVHIVDCKASTELIVWKITVLNQIQIQTLIAFPEILLRSVILQRQQQFFFYIYTVSDKVHNPRYEAFRKKIYIKVKRSWVYLFILSNSLFRIMVD